MCTKLEYDITRIYGIGDNINCLLKKIEIKTVQDLQIEGDREIQNRAKYLRQKLEELKANDLPKDTSLPSINTLKNFIEFANSNEWKYSKKTKDRYEKLRDRTLVDNYYYNVYHIYKNNSENCNEKIYSDMKIHFDDFIEFLQAFNNPNDNQFRKNLLNEFRDDWIDEENYNNINKFIGKKDKLNVPIEIKTKFNEYYNESILNWDDFKTMHREDKYDSRKCEYCGISEKQIIDLLDKKKIVTKRIISRGISMEIDQGDPNGGYNKNNIKLACYWCNNAKTDEFNEEEFKPIGDAIREAWNVRLSAARLDTIPDNKNLTDIK
jgi:hypothetical protein